MAALDLLRRIIMSKWRQLLNSSMNLMLLCSSLKQGETDQLEHTRNLVKLGETDQPEDTRNLAREEP